jgi:hypothetical protein
VRTQYLFSVSYVLVLNNNLLSVCRQQLDDRQQQLNEVHSAHLQTTEELQATVSDSDRFRYATQSEMQTLRNALLQKKELCAHLKQSLTDFRKEAEKKVNYCLVMGLYLIFARDIRNSFCSVIGWWYIVVLDFHGGCLVVVF